MSDQKKIPLHDWFVAHLNQDPELYYFNAMKRQVMWVRDVLADVVGCTSKTTFSISEHRSKSVVLPVYLLERPDLDVRFYLRNNFHNWKLSVDSKRPICENFAGLFMTAPPPEPDYTGDPLHSVYFEGFPSELVYGYYDPSGKGLWSAEIWTDEQLWTVLYLCVRYLDGIKEQQWGRRKVPA
jgi:hypothetical protein